MANHKSSEKRIRQTATRKSKNHYYDKTTRNAVKKLNGITVKAEAQELLPKVVSMLDRLSKRNVIHHNKASNLKSGLTKHVNNLK